MVLAGSIDLPQQKMSMFGTCLISAGFNHRHTHGHLSGLLTPQNAITIWCKHGVPPRP